MSAILVDIANSRNNRSCKIKHFSSSMDLPIVAFLGETITNKNSAYCYESSFYSGENAILLYFFCEELEVS